MKRCDVAPPHLDLALENFKAAERRHTRARGSLGKLTALQAQVGGGECAGKITFIAAGQVQDTFNSNLEFLSYLFI